MIPGPQSSPVRTRRGRVTRDGQVFWAPPASEGNVPREQWECRELTGRGSCFKNVPGRREALNHRAVRLKDVAFVSPRQEETMPAINSVAELTIDGEVAVVTINSPPVDALSPGGPRRPQARGRCGRVERRGQGDRDHLRRTDLHRRRRHLRIRKTAAAPYLPDVLDRDRERVEAGRRRAARKGARGRI